jgi:hypothetical protein
MILRSGLSISDETHRIVSQLARVSLMDKVEDLDIRKGIRLKIS